MNKPSGKLLIDNGLTEEDKEKIRNQYLRLEDQAIMSGKFQKKRKGSKS